uniref:transmembrane protein 143 isoform X1 n=2 Tax=Myxine glutinosa TaxID=7769 RepID=UPI00358F150E
MFCTSSLFRCLRPRPFVVANPSCHGAIRFLWLLSHSGITRLACPCWKHVSSTMGDLANIAGSRINVGWNPMRGTSQIMRMTTSQLDEGKGAREIHGQNERDDESIKALMNTVAEFWTRGRSKDELWTEAQAEYKERAIPLNFQELTQLIEKELEQSEKEHFRMVVKAVDAHLLTHYHGLLYEIQDLYFPMNPDCESRLEKEVPDVEDGCRKRKFFHLLSSLASAANYIRLSNKAVAFALTQHHPLDGPQVSVRLTEYDLIAFWALGEGPTKPGHDAWSKRPLHRRLLWRSPVAGPDRRVFARVMIFASITHGRTILKAFKDMPCTALDHTLPHVYPRVSILDRTLLTVSFGVGGLAVFVNVYMVLMSDLKLQLTLTLLLFAGVLGARALAAYRRRRATYLLGLSRMLYYKNTSNNADLLTALASRAHEQHLKEAMLVVALLLRNPAEGFTEVAIRQAVDAWLNRRCSRHIHTRPARSLSALCAAGCLEMSVDNVARLREPPLAKPSLGPALST